MLPLLVLKKKVSGFWPSLILTPIYTATNFTSLNLYILIIYASIKAYEANRRTGSFLPLIPLLYILFNKNPRHRIKEQQEKRVFQLTYTPAAQGIYLLSKTFSSTILTILFDYCIIHISEELKLRPSFYWSDPCCNNWVLFPYIAPLQHFTITLSITSWTVF